MVRPIEDKCTTNYFVRKFVNSILLDTRAQ